METTLSLPPWRKGLVERQIANDVAFERQHGRAIGSRVGRQLVAAWDEAEHRVLSRGAVWDRISPLPTAKGETRLDWHEMSQQDVKDSMRNVEQQMEEIRQEERK